MKKIRLITISIYFLSAVLLFAEERSSTEEKQNKDTFNIPLANASLLTIGDKLIFESLKEINGFKFRSYGYCKCEYGFSWSNDYKIFYRH